MSDSVRRERQFMFAEIGPGKSFRVLTDGPMRRHEVTQLLAILRLQRAILKKEPPPPATPACAPTTPDALPQGAANADPG